MVSTNPHAHDTATGSLYWKYGVLHTGNVASKSFEKQICHFHIHLYS
jgi:hypothetical protein